MGKKNKKLKKKKPSSSVQSYASQSETATTFLSPQPSLSAPATITNASTQEAPAAEFQYVRGDVKKILLLLLGIVVLLILLYILDQKTTLLTSTSDWFYKILNIQTQ